MMRAEFTIEDGGAITADAIHIVPGDQLLFEVVDVVPADSDGTVIGITIRFEEVL